MAGKPAISRNTDAQLSHQERVNLELFRAIEMLGRKLERAEGERERFGRRLIQIESSATVDEKTGKLYLPVVAGGDQLPQVIERAPKWHGAATLMSSALALLAIGIVLFREPVMQQQLTSQQLAALDALSHSRFARMDAGRWQPLDAETARDTAVNDIDIRRFTATDDPAAVPNETASAPRPYTGEETAVAAAETSPAIATELAAIEPAAGEAAVEAAPAVVARPPVAKPVLVKTRIAEAKPAAKKTDEEKPLQRPVNDYAPIPLIQEQAASAAVAAVETSAAEPAAKPVVKFAEKTAPVSVPVAAPVKTAAKAATQTAVLGVQADTALPGKLAALEKRAFEGAPEAQHDLATIYAAGKLVAQDYKRAVFWFSQAADRGVANAHYNLGVMFQQGLGVRQDVNKSLGWYEKAAELGHPEAMYNLGIAYIEGIGTKRNISRGVTFFKQAANAGVAQAAYNLGVMYESNFIGPIDLAKASEWYQVAAGEGHVEAKQAIARIKAGFVESFDGETTAAGGAAINDSGLKMAREIEPAAGNSEGFGEGDESPLDEQGRANPPGFGDSLVRKIQEALITRGELPPSTTTGYMTQQTEDAIRAWQKSLGWEVDGKPSNELLEKIGKK